MSPYRHVDPPPQLDYGPRGGPPLAFVWHFAEGVNVASYLSRNPARGVSVNFTIERKTSTFGDGEIVSMVPIDHISGTINPRTIRTNDDGPGSLGRASGYGMAGRYGITTARQVLGDRWRDPNRWCIGVEMAGRAVDGPTPAQVESMKALIADMRKRFPGMRGMTGHRDWQNVKPCPGRLVPWKEIGGHGLFLPKPVEVEPVTRIYSKSYPFGASASAMAGQAVLVIAYDPDTDKETGRQLAKLKQQIVVAIDEEIVIKRDDPSVRPNGTWVHVKTGEALFAGQWIDKDDVAVTELAPDEKAAEERGRADVKAAALAAIEAIPVEVPA